MARTALERWALVGKTLFKDRRERQYTRELLFSTVVELTSAVASQQELRSLGTPRAALLAFALLVAAYNIMALVQRAVAVAHQPERQDLNYHSIMSQTSCDLTTPV